MIGHESKTFKIPSTVTIKGKTFPVTSIGHISGAIKMQAIDVPDSVTTITGLSGSSCGRTSGSFSQCDNVTTFRFGPGSALQRIDDFSPSGLEEITIPAAVEVIQDSFDDCTSMLSFRFAPGSRLREIEGFKNCIISSLDIPDSVVSLKGFAKSRIGKLHFGEKSQLRKIEGFALASFESLEFPPSVVKIGYIGALCLEGVEDRTSFALQNGVKSITFAKGSQIKSIAAFACFGIDSIDLPDSLEIIDYTAFRCMPRLNRVIFGQNSQLRVIHGFRSSNLPEIDIPDSVEEIGYNAFCACSSLKRVGFGSNSKLRKLEGFHFCGFTSIELPASIEIVSDQAFLYCDQLKTVTIRGGSTLRKFSGMRPKPGTAQRSGKGRVIDFGPEACISLTAFGRFWERIHLYAGSEKDSRYLGFWMESTYSKHPPTFLRYSEASMRRFRTEFEWPAMKAPTKQSGYASDDDEEGNEDGYDEGQAGEEEDEEAG
jgi:hypothetical protein